MAFGVAGNKAHILILKFLIHLPSHIVTSRYLRAIVVTNEELIRTELLMWSMVHSLCLFLQLLVEWVPLLLLFIKD